MLKIKVRFAYHNKLAELEYLREFIAHAERREEKSCLYCIEDRSNLSLKLTSP